MTGIENYWGFLVAGVILNLTPGSDTMYILTRSISQGRKAGIYSVLGIAAGSFIHTLFAAVGLSTILSTSAIVFTAVKYIGVIYLFYLGAKTLFITDKQESTITPLKREKLSTIFYQGVFTNISNPKVALFFLSFLPQFIDTQTATTTVPFLILGLTFITTGTIWCLFLAYSASSVSTKLRDNPKIELLLKKVSGFIFIFLGTKLALSKS